MSRITTVTKLLACMAVGFLALAQPSPADAADITRTPRPPARQEISPPPRQETPPPASIVPSPPQPVETPLIKTVAPSDTRIDRPITVEFSGLPDGVTLSGLQDARDVYYELPAAVHFRDARIDVRGSYQMPGYSRAFLQVVLNDTIVSAVALDRQEGRFDFSVPLRTVDLDQRYLKVTYRLRAALTDDRCLDERVASGVVHIAHNAAVVAGIDASSVRTIQAAWSLLPPVTRIGLLDAQPSLDALTAAWRIGLALQNDGNLVEFVPAPGGATPWLPDILVGDDASLLARLDPRQPRLPGSQISLLWNGSSPLIAVTGPNYGAVGQFLDSFYRRIAEAPALSVAMAERPRAPGATSVTLDQIGFSTQERYIVDRGDWTIGFSLSQLPQGKVPDRFVLNIISAPRTGSYPNIAYVYYNDELVATEGLSDSKEAQRVVVHLPAHLTKIRNTLRVSLQREPVSIACTSHVQPFSAQVLGSSEIETADADGSPRSFAGLSPFFGDDTPIIIDEAALRAPVSLLRVLTPLSRSMFEVRPPKMLHTLSAMPVEHVSQPFLLVSTVSALQGRRTAVQMPVGLTGGLTISTKAGERMLDISHAGRLGVLQVATANGQPGLVAAIPDAEAEPFDATSLGSGNVAFFSGRRLLLSYHTEQDRDFRPNPPATTEWWDISRSGAILRLILVWGVLTALLIVVLRRMRRPSGT